VVGGGSVGGVVPTYVHGSGGVPEIRVRCIRRLGRCARRRVRRRRSRAVGGVAPTYGSLSGVRARSGGARRRGSVDAELLELVAQGAEGDAQGGGGLGLV